MQGPAAFFYHGGPLPLCLVLVPVSQRAQVSLPQESTPIGAPIPHAPQGRGTRELVRRIDDRLDRRQQERQRRRLAEEAHLIESLPHPGIPRLLHVDLARVPDSGRPASITLRDSQGVRLSEIMACLRGPSSRRALGRIGDLLWSFDGAMNVFVRLVETVAFAHGNGVVHRAIDPGAVVVGPFGAVQLLHWNLARDLARPDLHDLTPRTASDGADPLDVVLTQDGEALGPRAYLAPELLSGEQYLVGKATDVFALGAILWHLLTGRPPGVPASFGSPTRRAPRALKDIAARALSPQRRRRPQDAGQLLLLLEQVLTPDLPHANPLTAAHNWVSEHRLLTAALLAGVGTLVLHDPARAGSSPRFGFLNGPLGKLGGKVAAATKFEQSGPFLSRASIGAPARPTVRGTTQPPSPPRPPADGEPQAPLRDPDARVAAALVPSGSERVPSSSRPASLPTEPARSQSALLRRAVVARAHEHWQEACELFAELYHAQAASLGEDNAVTLSTRRELAACLVESGDSETALIHYYGCLAVHAARDDFALDLEREFAALLLARGERDEALQHLELAAGLARELHGARSPITLDILDSIASSAFRSGDLDRAAQSLELALESAQAETPAAHAGTSADQADATAHSSTDPADSEVPRLQAQRTTLVQIYQRLNLPAAALHHARELMRSTPEGHPARPARLALVKSLRARLDSD